MNMGKRTELTALGLSKPPGKNGETILYCKMYL